MVRMSRPAVPAARPIATSVARSRGAAVALSGGGNGGCIGGGVIIILASPAAAARRCRIFLHPWEAGEDVVVASGVTSSSLRSSGYGNPGSDRALRSGAVLPRIPTPDLGVEWRRRRRILAAASLSSSPLNYWWRGSHNGGRCVEHAAMTRRPRLIQSSRDFWWLLHSSPFLPLLRDGCLNLCIHLIGIGHPFW